MVTTIVQEKTGGCQAELSDTGGENGLSDFRKNGIVGWDEEVLKGSHCIKSGWQQGSNVRATATDFGISDPQENITRMKVDKWARERSCIICESVVPTLSLQGS